MKTIKYVLTFIIVVFVMYPVFFLLQPFSFTAKKAVWDVNSHLSLMAHNLKCVVHTYIKYRTFHK